MAMIGSGHRCTRGAGAFAAERAALQTMQEDGFVEVAGERITVTREGRPLVRAVAAVFDRNLKTGAARHSMAV